LAWRLATELYK